MRRRAPSSVSILQGAVGGLIGSAAVIAFETVWGRLSTGRVTTSEAIPPPTEAVADALNHVVFGAPLSPNRRWVAGQAVHYMTGAGLGVLYGLVVRRWPAVRRGAGVAFGLTVWATFEEAFLSSVELRPPPTRIPLRAHAVAAASHVIFGLTLDATLRLWGGVPNPTGRDRRAALSSACGR